MVCTLEPCNHHGKQPPCTEALLAAGVRRVVAAIADPNPVATGGAARLRAAGVDVELGLLAEAAAAQNAIFLHTPARPFASLCRTQARDHDRRPDRRRQRPFALAVGAAGAGFRAVASRGLRRDRGRRRDRPGRRSLAHRARPPGAAGDAPPDRVRRRWRRTSRRSAWSARRARRRPWSSPRRARRAGAARRRWSRGRRPRARAGAWSRRSGALREDGVTSLLVEGGGRLAGALLAEGLVDRYYWVQSAALARRERGVPPSPASRRRRSTRRQRWRVGRAPRAG